jgi:hypothetical protein
MADAAIVTDRHLRGRIPPESLVRHTKVSTIPSSNSFLVALMFWWRMYIEDRQTRYRDERAFSGNADIAMTPDWISH